MPRPSSEIAIPESVWEQHKKIIWNLYIHQNGKKKKVMEIMEAEHGFNATDWQFEEHFKKWGFRKNFRAEEWKAIQHHILKRKNAGRPDSDVYDNGLLVPKKKVQKGTYRNGTISTVERFTKCPSPKLPAGVVVCTPPASVVQWPKTGNLPWVSFHTMLVSRAVQFQPKDFNQIIGGEISAPRSSTAGVDFAMQIFQRHNPPLQEEREDKTELAYILQSTMPEMHPGEHLSTAHALSNPINHDSIPALVRMLGYALSNRLVPSDTNEKCYLLAKNSGILQTILSAPGSTSESLAEALIPLAIEDQSTSVMELLLSHVDVNQTVVGQSLRSHTLFQYALSKQKFEMISFLLKKGARIDFPQRTDIARAFLYLRHHRTSEMEDFLANIGAGIDNIRRLAIDGSNRRKQLAVILLSIGDNINALDQDGRSLLHHAVSNSCSRLVKQLLSFNADFHLKDKRGWTALHHATMNILQRAGRHAKAALRMVKTLLDYGADVNLTNCDGYTPLDYAIRRENKELIELLLTAGADVTNFDLGAESAQDEKSLSYILGFRRRDFGFLRPLSAQWAKMKRATLFAAAMDDRELLKKILHSGGKVDEPSRLGITALTASACRGNMEIAQLLLQHGADVNGRILTEGNNHALITPLHAAAKDSRMEMAKMLLASGASIDEVSSDGMTALDHAISRQDTEMTVFLLDSGAKPESSSTPETAIQIALRYRNMEVVKALIAAGADVNTQSLEMSSPLHIAVHMRGLSVVQMLVQAGADVNATDPLLGITPFHLAVSKGMADIAHYLLENGANLNFQSLATMASLEYAIMDEHIDVLHVFQQAGADFGAPDSYYLRFAQTHGKKAVVQYLHANYRPHLPLDYAEELTGSILRKDYSSLLSSLNSGAPVNSIDSRNQTPLMVAIMTDDIPLVEYLLGIGADPRDYLSLLCTVDKSSSHMLRILIAYCRCMDYRPKGFGCLALYAAILREKIEMVQILLEGRVNPNNRLSWGNYAEWNLGLKVIPPNVNHNLSIDHLMSLLERKTALDVAIYTGNMDIVELLLSHKDNAIGNHTIQSAVSGAVAERRLSVLPSLFKYVRDWNTPREGQFGRTLLQKTAEQGMLDIVKMILEAGADVNAPPAKDGGATALQAAAIQGHYGVVLCLLEKGGNVNAEPAEVNGRTAIEGAAEHGRIDILQLLLNAGARVDDAHYQQALLFAFNNGHFAAYRLLQAHRSSFDCDTEDS